MRLALEIFHPQKRYQLQEGQSACLVVALSGGSGESVQTKWKNHTVTGVSLGFQQQHMEGDPGFPCMSEDAVKNTKDSAVGLRSKELLRALLELRGERGWIAMQDSNGGRDDLRI